MNRKTKNFTPSEVEHMLHKSISDDETIPENEAVTDIDENQRTMTEGGVALDRDSSSGLGNGGVAPDAGTPHLPRFGKYKVVRKIGSGGMGCVYEGRHPDLDIPVAIKTIRNDHGHAHAFVDRFIREARIATKLSHAHVVRVYDADRDGDAYFIVQEFVDGKNLREVIEDSPLKRLELKEAVEITIAITTALIEAEKHSIVHRDIKPSNILISSDGVVKLADMGLAKQYEPDADANESDYELTNSGSSMGSPCYMAPEQIVNSKNVDIRADIYSLGATLYHMVTGELPFAGHSSKEIMMKRLHEQTPDPDAVHQNLPPAITRIISGMMAKSRSDRYQSPSELLVDLEAFLNPPRSRRWIGFAAAAVIGLMLMLWHSTAERGRVAEQLARVETELGSGDYAGALSVLNDVSRTTGSDDRLLYAYGLCYLHVNDMGKLLTVREQLQSTPLGSEMAGHLEALLYLRDNDPEAAEGVIAEWLPTATAKLPFMHSKGLILRARGREHEALDTFRNALNEPAFFDFQRLAIIDSLADMLAATGALPEAKGLYENVLSRTDARHVPPHTYANYAVTLVQAGDVDHAQRVLSEIPEGDPAFDIAAHLRRQMAPAAHADTVAETMAMIDDIAAAVTGNRANTDRWTSTPILLTILPLDNDGTSRTQLGVADMWHDLLVDMIREHTGFPVVDRESLQHILRELQLNAAELGSDQARLKIGRLLPATVLIRGSFSEIDPERTVTLRLIDVETTEIVAAVRKTTANSTRADLIAKLGAKLAATLRDHYPIAGRVTDTSGERVEVNIGSYHGLREGQRLAVYANAASPNPRLLRSRPALAVGRVTGLDKFAATITVDEPVGPIEPGALIISGEETVEE